MTTLILVRHGQSEANVSRHFACRTDTPLSPLGKQQAQALAAYLPQHFKIDKIYASTLSRTRDTVLPTAAALGLPVFEDAGLLEIDAGRWENVHTSILKEDKTSGFDLWQTDVGSIKCPDGESVAELFDRVVGTVLRLAAENEGKTLLRASHWTPIHALLTFAKGKTVKDMQESDFIIPNASLHVLTFENGRLTPVALGIVEHLEALA